jgi:hypothetical protein
MAVITHNATRALITSQLPERFSMPRGKSYRVPAQRPDF